MNNPQRLNPFKDEEHRECAKFCKEKVEHEDNTLGSRMMWFVLFQGLLMSGLGALLDKDKFYLAMLALTGVLVSISFGVMFYLGRVAVANILNFWDDYCRDHSINHATPVIGLRRKPGVWGWIRHYLTPTVCLPFLFGTIWFAVGWYSGGFALIGDFILQGWAKLQQLL